MTVTIVKEPPPQQGIPAEDLQETQIAEVIAWDTDNQPALGKVVHRSGARLYVLGEVGYYTLEHHSPDRCRVRPLEDGTQLDVTDNQ